MTQRLLEQLSDALQVAPYKPDQWMTALGLMASATNSSHGEFICWTTPKKTPFKLISNLADDQATLIRDWETQVGADPTLNPIIARGIVTPVMDTLSDDEVIRDDERSRHIVWNEYYRKLDMHHMCFSPLWRDSESVLGLFLLRSFNDGPVDRDERRLFRSIAHRWRDAAMTARALKEEGARVLAGALDGLSIHTIILDGLGRCTHLSPYAEALISAGSPLTIRTDRLRLSHGLKATAECPQVQRTINLDSDLQPCVDCVTRTAFSRGAHCRNCSILIQGPFGCLAHLRISAVPRDQHEISFGAAAIIVMDSPETRSLAELRPDVAALLTRAETDVAVELLNGRRPAEIALRRGVSIETIRSQIKRMYAKLDVTGLVEFIARARR